MQLSLPMAQLEGTLLRLPMNLNLLNIVSWLSGFGDDTYIIDHLLPIYIQSFTFPRRRNRQSVCWLPV